MEERSRSREWLLDAVGDGVVLFDAGGRVVLVNRAAAAILGVEQDAAVGGGGEDPALPFPAGWSGAVRRAIAEGREVELEPTDVPRGGEQVRVAGRAHPAPGGGAAAVFHRAGDAAHMRDDLVERNAELKRARDELEGRNVELREATRAKDRFLATMSHEMRTPLNAILGYIELLNMEVAGKLTDTQRHQVERIRGSGRALLDLINDVLDFTRADAGRLAVELRPLSAFVVAEEAAELVRPQADARGLTLRIERPEDEPELRVRADFRRLRQILANLLSNAVKFTADGEVSIRVRRADEERVAISVSDTGIGIDESKLPHIFSEFYQADSELTREYGGTGLGLAISQRLAWLMNGEISVESERGVGSTFTLTLPAADAASAADEPDEEAAAPAAAVEAPVPVVAFGEDEAALSSLRHQLAPHVRLAGTTVPENVAELARRQHASLIVLDVACRDGIGWEAAHEIREDPALDDVAMLLLPCFPTAQPAGAAGAIDLGWVAVVPKPFTPDQLTRVVESAAGSPAGAGDRALDVLVVDDDRDAREIAERILTTAGAVVRVAEDGEAGLAEMRRAAPDVAVLDLMMPVLDGFGVLAAMRADPALREIPVVVLTAKDLSPPERRFLARTAETVLQKGVHSFADVAGLVLRATGRGAEG